MNNLTFGDDDSGYYETIAGGAGAVTLMLYFPPASVSHIVFFQGPTWHGRSGVHSHMTNTRITDPEILERR